MIFEYKALNSEGHMVNGEKESETRQTLATDLKGEQLVLISAQTKKKKQSFNFSFSTLNTREKISFARNLSSMLHAGLSLSRALEVIARQTKKVKAKALITTINTDIKSGLSLSDALQKQKKYFNTLFVSMVKAGEESGNLADAFVTISSQMEKNYLLLKKVKGAMVYPGVIISAMIVVGIFMMTSIVPTLAGTFVELNVDLPASTQFIILISDTLRGHPVLFLLGTMIFVILLIFIFKSEKGKKAVISIVMRLPIFGELVKEIQSARTARTLSSLLTAGVSYLQSVQITKDVISNHIYKNILEDAIEKVESGDKISQVFSDNEKYYPPFVGEMIAVGEETGEIGNMLLKVAEFYEGEVDQRTKNLSTIIEPLLMLVVGAGVGFFAISMISPMYSLMDNL